MKPPRQLFSPFPVVLVLAAAAAAPAQQLAEPGTSYFPAVRDVSSGMAVADVDGDGDVDVFIANSGVINGEQDRLFLNDGAGNFTDATATHLPQRRYRSQGAAFGDVDGDGDLDLVTANIQQNRVLLNDGSGRFVDETFARMPVETTDSRRVAVADLDGDGDLDLAFAQYRQELLYLNDGSGRFTDVSAARLPVNATSTWDIKAGDADGDGDLDLLLAEQNTHRLWLNDGNATFTDAGSRLPSVNTRGATVSFVDVDGDGDLDIAAGNYFRPPTLYLNDGTGQFTDVSAARMPGAMLASWDMTTGDVDGDGDQDLILSGLESENVLLRNDGSGTFTDVTATRMPRHESTAFAARLADLDGDGDLDLVTAERAARNKLFFNDGSGTFVDATRKNLDAVFHVTRAVALRDLDGDGDLDMVTANGYAEGVNYPDRLLLNDGRGGFRNVSAANLPVDADDTRAVAAGDLDNDGDIDLVFGNSRGQNRVYLNDGTAHFTDVTAAALPVRAEDTTGLALGDVNGDGRLDLVVANYLAPCRVLLGDGTGRFVDSSATLPDTTLLETRDVALFDADGDGKLDVLLAAGLWTPQRNRLWHNDGTGQFTDATIASLPNEEEPTSSLAVGDIDGDGDLDVACGNDDPFFGRTNTMYVNNGSGGFAMRYPVYDYFRTYDVELADIDDDGDLDLLCADHNHYNKLYLNDGTGQFVDGTSDRMPLAFETTTALVTGDVDGDGDRDLLCGNEGAWNGENILYLNHARQIGGKRLLQLGTIYPLDVYSQRAYATAPQTAFVLIGTAPAQIPFAPYGTLGVNPAGMVVLPAPILAPPEGHATVAIPVPPVQGLLGLELWLQALVVPTANPADARLTNVLREPFVAF